MKVLVTGGSGFIGQHCVRELVKRGHEVHAPPRGEVNLLHLETHKPMIVNVAPDAILHLAWIATPGEFWASDENLSWMLATTHLGAMANRCEVPRMVFSGTCAETTTFYGDCKDFARRTVADMADAAGFSSAYARIFTPYGPGDHPLRLIPYITRTMLRGEYAVIATGDVMHDFIYVKDVAIALVRLLESDVTGSVDIGTGYAAHVRDVATMVAAHLGTADLLRMSEPQESPPFTVADPTRLRDEVGYVPHYPLIAGINSAVDCWR